MPASAKQVKSSVPWPVSLIGCNILAGHGDGTPYPYLKGPESGLAEGMLEWLTSLCVRPVPFRCAVACLHISFPLASVMLTLWWSPSSPLYTVTVGTGEEVSDTRLMCLPQAMTGNVSLGRFVASWKRTLGVTEVFSTEYSLPTVSVRPPALMMTKSIPP